MRTIGRVLRRLRIENLVLIREAELELAPGLNAITGETGAGKTILAHAIGLLLGSRGDPALVGPDGDEAYVEAELDLPEGLLDEEGFEPLAELRPEAEEGLVLARRVFSDGRTRAYAWGRAAARDDVAAAAERLLAMSGQFEQRRLARASYQLDVLDAFCGEEQVRCRAETRRAWRELQAARRRHQELRGGAEAAEARLAELRALVEDTLGMEAEDEDSLRAERERLRHVTELAAGAGAAGEALAPDDGEGAASLVAAAERAISPLESLAPELRRAGDELRDIELRLRETATELRSFLASLDAEPDRLEQIEAELDRIAEAKRRFRCSSYDELLARAAGGELSRIALAIAAVGGSETIVFDEIDAGIGGQTAHAVGETLERLATRAQVLTITHLPQIASRADRHFRVEKLPGDPTHTRIDPLVEPERRDEIQRMLGGQEFLTAVQAD